MDAALYAPPGSAALPFAEAIAWLWRLGRVSPEPAPSAVGIGWLEDVEGLDGLLEAGELRGAVIFCPRPGPDVRWIPPRRRVAGIARFAAGFAARGQFPILDGGEA